MMKLPLRGADNARDFGGTTAAGGRTIIPGAFVRCNHLARLRPVDVDLLCGRYPRLTVIDLRTPTEARERPDRPMPGATFIHLPLIDERAFGITHERDAKDKAALLARLPDMRELYRMFVTDDHALAQLRRVFGIILAREPDETILWHCTEGKDRAGIVSALLLELLGTPRPAIMDDYLATNQVAAKRARATALKALALTLNPALARKVKDLFLADPAYLEAAFDAVDRHHGSPSALFTGALGLDPAAVEAFRERHLA